MSTNQQGRRVGDRDRGYTKSWPRDPGLKENHGSSSGGMIRRRQIREYKWGSSRYASWGEGFYENLARHEHYLAAQMDLKPGMRVLEVGCGTGGSAREIATYSEAYVVGLNSNQDQVQEARWSAECAGLEGLSEFVKGDIMRLAQLFGENSFDAVYVMEPKCQTSSWEGIYGQVEKVLKPGGVFGVYAWCMTDAWDPSIPFHKALEDQLKLRELAYQLKVVADQLKILAPLLKVPLLKEFAYHFAMWNILPDSDMRRLRDVRQAFTNVGFKIEHEEDLAARPDALPWYHSLKGFQEAHKAKCQWDMLTILSTSWFAKVVMQNLRLLDMTGLTLKGASNACETLKGVGNALIKGAELRLSTPVYLVIAKKPSK